MQSALKPTLLAIAYSLVVPLAPHQPAITQDSASGQRPDDRSFYSGKPVPHPEELSGVWEAPDGKGGAVGLHLTLVTTAPADATTRVGVSQEWDHLEVGIYHRVGAVFEIGEENGFSDSVRGGGVRYESGKLTLHSGSSDLELQRVDGGNWSGRVHYKDFDSQVRLSRPESQSKSKDTWLVGTWREKSDSASFTCLHIVETSPGEFAGWSDYLLTWGNVRFASNARKPKQAFENYGNLVRVRPDEQERASIVLGWYGGICCPRPFVGTPENDGAMMRAEWPAGPNQAHHTSHWTKMRGNSCTVESE